MKRILPLLLILCVPLLGEDMDKPLPKDFKSLKALAEKGSVNAQLRLSTMFAEKQDFEEAFMWCLKAARVGHAGAQFNLGQMYRDGQGVPRNPENAVEWYRKAAEQGLAVGQFNLGAMY